MDYVLAFDVCSTVLLFFLIFSLFLRKAVHGISNKIFLFLLFTVFFSGIADIICCVFPSISVQGYDNYFIIAVCTYLYFIFFSSSVFLYSIFINTCCTSWNEFKNRLSVRGPWLLICAVQIFLVFSNSFTNNLFSISSRFVFRRGEYFEFYYLCHLFLYINIVFKLIKSLSFIPRSKFCVFLSVFILSAAGSVFQYFHPQIRIEVFSLAFPMFLITLVIQRPEETVNHTTGLLNLTAFKEQLKKVFILKEDYDIIFIKIAGFNDLKNRYKPHVIRMLLSQLVNKFYMLCPGSVHDFFYLDEGFFAVCSSELSREYLDAVAEGLCIILKEPQKIEKMEILLKSKICLANCPEDFNDIPTLLNFILNFDNAVFQTNEVLAFSDIASSRDFLIKINMDDIIKDAISGRKFQMYYQPIYNIKTNTFTCAEALIRLIDEKYGFVSPGLFIPAAEVSGAIHKIGDFVFDAVFNFISRCDFDSLGLEYIELNLSVVQAIEDNLLEKIDAGMEKYLIAPQKINVEITETAADFNPLVFDYNINAIAQRGVSFSLDDYGTGYSNIKRVTELPLDIIKLDKSFVDEWKNEKMNIIIRETVSMFKKMNKKVLVEGVEDEQAADFFKELGCDYIQGFYYSKPLPEKDFLDFIVLHNRKMLKEGEE